MGFSRVYPRTKKFFARNAPANMKGGVLADLCYERQLTISGPVPCLMVKKDTTAMNLILVKIEVPPLGVIINCDQSAALTVRTRSACQEVTHKTWLLPVARLGELHLH